MKMIFTFLAVMFLATASVSAQGIDYILQDSDGHGTTKCTPELVDFSFERDGNRYHVCSTGNQFTALPNHKQWTPCPTKTDRFVICEI